MSAPRTSSLPAFQTPTAAPRTRGKHRLCDQPDLGQALALPRASSVILDTPCVPPAPGLGSRLPSLSTLIRPFMISSSLMVLNSFYMPLTLKLTAPASPRENSRPDMQRSRHLPWARHLRPSLSKAELRLSSRPVPPAVFLISVDGYSVLPVSGAK